MKPVSQIVLAVAVVVALAGGVFLLVRGPGDGSEIDLPPTTRDPHDAYPLP